LVGAFLVRNWCGCLTRSDRGTEWEAASFLELRQRQAASIIA
jgi:hypothetical protein